MAVPRMPQRPSIPVECRPAHPTACCVRFLSSATLRILPCASFRFLPPGAPRITPRASFRFLPRGALRFLSSASSTMLRTLSPQRDSAGRGLLVRFISARRTYMRLAYMRRICTRWAAVSWVKRIRLVPAWRTRFGPPRRHRALDGESTRPPGTGSPNLSLPVACRACVRRGRHRVPALHG